MKVGQIEVFPEEVLEIARSQKFLGIRLSGGIDSAILCHIVLKFFPEIKIMPITFYNVLKPSAKKSVDNVLNILNKLTPTNNVLPQEIGYFDTTGYIKDPTATVKKHPKDLFQKQFINSLFEKYNPDLNFILAGESLNPPIEVQAALGVEGMFSKYRNETSPPLHLYYYKNDKKYEYRPFRNHTKKQIAEVCKELGLLEKLFPYTESCESTPNAATYYYGRLFNVKYTEPGVEPCQGCWPCREKYWAYGVFDFNTKLRASKIDHNIINHDR